MSNSQKKENLFRLERGGRYAQRPMRMFTTAEIQLDSEMAEVVGAVKGANGKAPTRGFQRVLYGEAFPWRVLARWFVAARKAKAPKSQLKGVVARLDSFVESLYADSQDSAA
jgi:hypothetical protein